jgi:hypothetical protein
VALYPGSGFYPDDLAYPGADTGQHLTATPEPDSSPPRVRLDFTDATSAPVSSLTISRLDANGRTWAVRTSDGGPLTVSGGAATIYDYEVPYGTRVTYSTDIVSGPTAVAVLDVARPWLIHVGVPSRSATFHNLAGSQASETWDIDQGVFAVLGRSTPIITTGGARVVPASSLVIHSATDDEKAALSLLLSDGAPLLLNVPQSLGWGIGTSYIAVGRVQVDRPIGILSVSHRSLTLPYQQVARPGGGTQAAITWNTVAAKYATWQDILDAGITSWAELAAPTG